MLGGYFILGGTQSAATLPLFDDAYTGSHVGSKVRGLWLVDTDFDQHTINLPARDKQVQLWANLELTKFTSVISGVDSSYEGLSYKAKLNTLRNEDLNFAFQGIVNNLSSSTHGSLAILSSYDPIYLYGLHDTQLETTYLVWHTDKDFIHRMMNVHPLRYLIYRFPPIQDNVIFIQSEAICSKWWGWLKSHRSHLHAFNALEKRLFQ